jgi:cobyrinic acid a,c-diamide synthase
MIVGTSSGSGKTTVTCGILKALSLRGLRVAGFKCGPDYIDPMFHSKVLGIQSRNLDVFLSGEEGIRFLLAKSSTEADVSVIEGVMGMYDGLSMESEEASSNHVASLTQTPEILVVDVKGMALSAAALIGGFLSFRPNLIRGVILNRCSEAMYPIYKKMIEEELDITVYGFLPMVSEAAIESRHLGLVTADEIEDLQYKLDLLAAATASFIDLDGLLALGDGAAPHVWTELWEEIKPVDQSGLRIGVARDQAFCFFYQDNLDLLERLGAELVYFSPLEDSELPHDINGLILYGGYPEEFAAQLSVNTSMLEQVRKAVQSGMPTLAECGGFMYLMESLVDRQGHSFPMTGVISGHSWMTHKLSRFGYLKLTALSDNLLCKEGDTFHAHEFHYSESDHNGEGCLAEKKDRSWHCIHLKDHLFAGYPHLHFAVNTRMAKKFAEKCFEFKKSELETGRYL